MPRDVLLWKPSRVSGDLEEKSGTTDCHELVMVTAVEVKGMCGAGGLAMSGRSVHRERKRCSFWFTSQDLCSRNLVELRMGKA